MGDDIVFHGGAPSYVVIACVQCGKRKAKGSTAARYCSDACRQAAYRDRKAEAARKKWLVSVKRGALGTDS